MLFFKKYNFFSYYTSTWNAFSLPGLKAGLFKSCSCNAIVILISGFVCHRTPNHSWISLSFRGTFSPFRFSESRSYPLIATASRALSGAAGAGGGAGDRTGCEGGRGGPALLGQRHRPAPGSSGRRAPAWDAPRRLNKGGLLIEHFLSFSS